MTGRTCTRFDDMYLHSCQTGPSYHICFRNGRRPGIMAKPESGQCRTHSDCILSSCFSRACSREAESDRSWRTFSCFSKPSCRRLCRDSSSVGATVKPAVADIVCQWRPRIPATARRASHCRKKGQPRVQKGLPCVVVPSNNQ
jgi:hypothetical protein